MLLLIYIIYRNLQVLKLLKDESADLKQVLESSPSDVCIDVVPLPYQYLQVQYMKQGRPLRASLSSSSATCSGANTAGTGANTAGSNTYRPTTPTSISNP